MNRNTALVAPLLRLVSRRWRLINTHQKSLAYHAPHAQTASHHSKPAPHLSPLPRTSMRQPSARLAKSLAAHPGQGVPRTSRANRSFNCTYFLIVKVTSPEEIEQAVRAKLLSTRMQAGQRNADGSSRRAKYGVHMTRATAAIGGAHMVVLRYPPKG